MYVCMYVCLSQMWVQSRFLIVHACKIFFFNFSLDLVVNFFSPSRLSGDNFDGRQVRFTTGRFGRRGRRSSSERGRSWISKSVSWAAERPNTATNT